MSLLTLNLTIAGVLLTGLGALHIALPAALGWHRELARASPLNREVSYVHCFFIGLTCVLWGLLALTARGHLLQPAPVTRLVLIGAVAFWASRLIIQLAVFNRHASESAGWLAVSTAGTILWLYLTAVWTLTLIAQYQPEHRPPRPASYPAFVMYHSVRALPPFVRPLNRPPSRH